MQLNYRHGLMPRRPYLLGNEGIDAQEAAEAAARAGRQAAEAESGKASSGAGVAAAARYAYEQALLAKKTEAEAAEAARVATVAQKAIHDARMEQDRQDAALRAFAENKAASDYYQSLRESRLGTTSPKSSGLVTVALVAAAAYFALKG